MALVLLSVVSGFSIALGSPILTISPNDGGSVQCYGDVIQLVCTHPVLDPSDYFVGVFWEMNGVQFGPDNMEIIETINTTSASLRIHLTRELFDSKEIIFRCFLFQQDITKEYSNEVTVDPLVVSITLNVIYLVHRLLKKPLRPDIKKVQPHMSSISLTWEHDLVCFEDYTFSFTISWCTFENGVPHVSTCHSTTTSTTDITLSNLVPSTTYQVNITAQSVENSTIRSDTVEMKVTILGSPLPPTSLTFIPSDTSISLMWSHSDECFENCTFMYEVTWQQSRDGSSLRNATTTETSYTIEGLTPGTSYEIGIRSRAYCKENLDVKNMIIQITLDTRKASSPSFTIDSTLLNSWIVAFGVITSLLAISLTITCVLAVYSYKKRKKENPNSNSNYDSSAEDKVGKESTDIKMERNPAYACIELDKNFNKK